MFYTHSCFDTKLCISKDHMNGFSGNAAGNFNHETLHISNLKLFALKNHRKGQRRRNYCSIPAATKGISADAAAAAVFSGLDGTSTFKEKTKNNAEGCPQWKTCFHFAPDRFWQNIAAHRGSGARLNSPFAPVRSLELFPRWIGDKNLIDLGNVPSGVSGYSRAIGLRLRRKMSHHIYCGWHHLVPHKLITLKQ